MLFLFSPRHGKTSVLADPGFHFVRNFLPLAFVLVLLTRPRRWYWFAGFYLVQTFYMALNLIYHFSLGDFLRFSQFIGLQSEAIDLAKYTNVPLDTRLWILAVDLPFFIAMVVVYSKFSNANKRMFFKPTLVLGALIMVAALLLWNPLSRSPKLAPDTSLYSDAAMVAKYGLLAFNIMDILNYRKTKAQTLSLRAGPEHVRPGNGRAASGFRADPSGIDGRLRHQPGISRGPCGALSPQSHHKMHLLSRMRSATMRRALPPTANSLLSTALNLSGIFRRCG